ncbi:MAG: helix-turn-helix domain-containing protein [Eubacteriales bacterium]|nr:helix-turn-helix domain-containing protein [Eubacteriales bacterium]
MNILLVDDEYYSVKALMERICWERIAGEEVVVLAAYHAAQAREIMTQKEIDIVVCDIEMPRENGIAFLKWVREQEMDCEAVIITSHEQFQYAKEAVALNVSEYCVKPLDFMQMEELLRRLAGKITKKRGVQEKSRYGEYWMENREQLERNLWENLLGGVYQNQWDRLLQDAAKIDLPVSEGREFHLILISIRRFQMRLARWDQEKIQQSVLHIAGEILGENQNAESVLRMGTEIAVIARKREEKWLCERCETLMETCREILQLKLCCYLSSPCAMGELCETYARLSNLAYEDVARTEGIVKEEENEKKTSGAMGEADGASGIPWRILTLIETGQTGEFAVQLHLWLSREGKSGRIDRERLLAFRESFLQAIYHDLTKLELSANTLYEHNPLLKSYYYRAEESVEYLEAWIKMMLGQLEEENRRYREEGNVQSVSVVKMKEFIEAHLEEALTREQIAEAVNLHPDYAARIFKKEEQESVMEYLYRRRIGRAVDLIRTTELPFHEIAQRSGFVNTAHFSTAFKKATGKSPREYRKEWGR